MEIGTRFRHDHHYSLHDNRVLDEHYRKINGKLFRFCRMTDAGNVVSYAVSRHGIGYGQSGVYIHLIRK